MQPTQPPQPPQPPVQMPQVELTAEEELRGITLLLHLLGERPEVVTSPLTARLTSAIDTNISTEEAEIVLTITTLNPD